MKDTWDKNSREVYDLLATFFGNEDKAIEWFRTKNLLLGGQSPIDMVNAGRSEKLLKFVRNSIKENYPDNQFEAPRFDTRSSEHEGLARPTTSGSVTTAGENPAGAFKHDMWCPIPAEMARPFDLRRYGVRCTCDKFRPIKEFRTKNCYCEDIRYRRWNPASGLCESCGANYNDPFVVQTTIEPTTDAIDQSCDVSSKGRTTELQNLANSGAGNPGSNPGASGSSSASCKECDGYGYKEFYDDDGYANLRNCDDCKGTGVK